MSEIAARVLLVKERIAAACKRAGREARSVTLVAVSKTHPVELIRAAHAAGLRAFGENYVQELREKQAALDGLELAWHLVGRLQRNKAKDVVGRAALVHALDGLPLADALSRRAAGVGVVQDVLVEVNLGGEATKGGIEPSALPALLDAMSRFPGLRCRGLMAIPPPAANPGDNRPHFRALAKLARAHGLAELSMGMSDDFEEAIEEGATIVRVGTAIFGARLVG